MLTVTVRPTCVTRIVHVPAYGAMLAGELVLPNSAHGLVVFVEGAKFSSAHAADRVIAHSVEHAGFATLRLDLLTPDEERVEDATRGLSSDVALLSRRLSDTLDWIIEQPTLDHLPIGLFVTGSDAGAALVASAVEQGRVGAIVSTAGRLERAAPVLTRVTTPTLFIVAGDDAADTHEAEAAFRRMPGACELVLVHGPLSRLHFAGAAEEIGRHALAWFEKHLGNARTVTAVSGEAL
jgi:alpha-beta hydrolase superfamily lysophospholipase